MARDAPGMVLSVGGKGGVCRCDREQGTLPRNTPRAARPGVNRVVFVRVCFVPVGKSKNVQLFVLDGFIILRRKVTYNEATTTCGKDALSVLLPVRLVELCKEDVLPLHGLSLGDYLCSILQVVDPEAPTYP